MLDDSSLELLSPAPSLGSALAFPGSGKQRLHLAHSGREALARKNLVFP